MFPKNNNATIPVNKITKELTNKLQVRSKIRSADESIQIRSKSMKHIGQNKKVTPIIQTRGMKAKAAQSVSQADLNSFDEINNLTSSEFSDGEHALSDVENNSEPDHDGVELLIQGSDFEDEFGESSSVPLQ